MWIRSATAADAHTILRCIEALAAYEREPDAVQTDAATLAAQLSEPSPPFECLLAFDEHGDNAGFALYFHNYSTWRGARGIHLEDLFVYPHLRGKGFGRALLRAVANVAVERDCPRLEWAVLDWNQPAIDFYLSLGATPLDEWTTFRIADEALRGLASAGAAST